MEAFRQLTVTLFVAWIGGWLGHYLSTRRDLVNDRRKLRITYLLDAYRKLENASNRGDASRAWPQFESAIADIQLLGTPAQVRLARQFALDMARYHTAPLDELIFDLRQSLRAELHLSPVQETVLFLRYSDERPAEPPPNLRTGRLFLP